MYSVTRMNSRQVIAEAWEFTKEHRPLMWWYAFVPSLLTTLIGILYIGYQFFSFKRSPLFENAPRSFLTEVIGTTVTFLNAHSGLWFPAFVIVTVVLILYALLPTLCQGALVQIIARKKAGEKVRVSDGIAFGMLVFLPLLEYHLLIKAFSLFSLFTEAAFVVRNLGTEAFSYLFPIFILIAVIGFALTLLFTYSEFFIILEKRPVLSAIGKSTKLVILSWQHTFLIAILMLIIGLRVIVNIIAVLLVPALIFLAAGFIATITLSTIGAIIGAIITFISLLVTAYFSGILNVFANAVWTLTFVALTKEKRTQEFMEN